MPGTLREKIGGLAQEVLDARESYAQATLADLYDPDDAWMYPALYRAHRMLDAWVLGAYDLPGDATDDDTCARLFELCADLTE